MKFDRQYLLQWRRWMPCGRLALLCGCIFRFNYEVDSGLFMMSFLLLEPLIL